jgi:amidase
VCPTWCSPPFEHGFDISSEANAHAVLDLIRCVLPPNALGLPAAVVPAAVVDGLPVGVQVIADRWQDLLCLEAAEAVERAVGTFTPIDPR